MRTVFVSTFVLIACASSTPATTKTEAEAAYTASQLACVEQAKTIEESKACRAKVRANWAVDGGAR